MATVLAPPRVDRAFERLYRRHVTDVYRYVLAVLQNEADAEDATQATFLSAFRAFERGDRPERPHNWLITIAHNVCRQRFRESARRPRCVELVDDVADRQVDEGATSAEEIRRALGFLAFNQRAALVMREVQGRSYGEIANILGVSNAAVETLLFRARRAMREQLEGALSCGDAELALSKRVDGELSFGERGQLRAHLRECAECAALERRLRFRSRAVRKAGLVPLPDSLGSFLGGGAAATGATVGTKAAAVIVAGVFGTTLAGHAIDDTLGARDDRTVAASAPRTASSADAVGAAVVSPRVRFAGPAQAIFKPRGAARRGSAAASARAGARTGGRPSAGASPRPAPGAALTDGSPSSSGGEATPAARERPASTSRGRSEATEAVPARQPPAEPGNVTERRKVVDLPSVPELPKAPELPKPPDLPKVPALPAPEVPKLPDVSRVADAPKLPELPKPPELPTPTELPKPPEPPKPPEVPTPPQVPAPPQVPSPPELPKLP
jgi:RNA polymerase sigma factor (sigma-70 family)